MEHLQSEECIIILVEDNLENDRTLEFPVKSIKKKTHNESFLLKHIKTEKSNPEDLLNVTVKIEYVPDEYNDIEDNKNVSKDFFPQICKVESNLNLNTNCIEKDDTKDNAIVKIEQPLFPNQNSEAVNKNDIKVEKFANYQQEIDCLEEENNEDYITLKNVKDIKFNSYIRDLKLQFPELKDDEELLVDVLTRIMKEVRAPPLPENFYKKCLNKFECIFCGTITQTLPAVERHYLEKHGSRYLLCYACGVTFRSRTNLYKHEKRCKAKDIDIVLKARAIFLGGKGQNRPFLDLYKRKVQGCNKMKIQKFPCNMCPATFVSKQGLQSHENIHFGRRPYHCDKCSNAYTCLRTLKRHRAKHDNIRYICHTCNGSFISKEILTVHMDTHLPTKKYGCPECDRRYSKKHAMNLHLNKVHKNLPYPFACLICNKRYARLSKLKEHMQNEHGLYIMSRHMFMKKLPTLSEQDVLKAKIIMMSDYALLNGEPVIIDD